MKTKTPAFWYRAANSKTPLIERILTPVSWLYRLGYIYHQTTNSAQKADLPILCIGNINAGGTGKTPTALALKDLITTHKIADKPYYLLRGFGGGERGPLLVDPSNHTSWDTGDEALELAAQAPTIVSADRIEGTKLATEQGADLVIMDDGLQNPTIHKDVSLVVINGEMGFGNKKLFPAGPLREPLRKGLARADAFILIGEDKRSLSSILPEGKPVFSANLAPDTKNAPDPKQRYIAFAGLGYPQKFFNFLRDQAGLNLVECVKFSDHYPYADHDLERLKALAQEKNAQLITTQKDYMRLPKEQRADIAVMKVKLQWDDETGLAEFLQSRLSLRA